MTYLNVLNCWAGNQLFAKTRSNITKNQPAAMSWQAVSSDLFESEEPRLHVGQTAIPSKIEWDLTNGPLSCDRAILRDPGSVQWVLLEISWSYGKFLEYNHCLTDFTTKLHTLEQYISKGKASNNGLNLGCCCFWVLPKWHEHDMCLWTCWGINN